MNCLTLAATRTEEKPEKFRKCNILVIDGCNEDCGRKIMKSRGINDYKYLRVTDLGYEKYRTEVKPYVINDVYDKAQMIF
jgi:uncharacterized metal-binding protein